MISSEILLGLPEYKITGIEQRAGRVVITAQHATAAACPQCGGTKMRLKDKRIRCPRHESWGQRRTELELTTHKWKCKECKHIFWSAFRGCCPASELPRHSGVAYFTTTGMESAAAVWPSARGSAAQRWNAGVWIFYSVRPPSGSVCCVRPYWALMSTSLPVARAMPPRFVT